MSHLKKYGLMGTIKRVRIKKRQKTNKEDVYQINKKSKSSSKSDFGSNDHLFEGTRIKDEAEKQIKTNVEKTEKVK